MSHTDLLEDCGGQRMRGECDADAHRTKLSRVVFFERHRRGILPFPMDARALHSLPLDQLTGAERLTLVFDLRAQQSKDPILNTLTTDAQPEVVRAAKLALGLDKSRHRDRATSRGNLAERLIDCHALLREKLRTVFRDVEAIL